MLLGTEILFKKNGFATKNIKKTTFNLIKLIKCSVTAQMAQMAQNWNVLMEIGLRRSLLYLLCVAVPAALGSVTPCTFSSVRMSTSISDISGQKPDKINWLGFLSLFSFCPYFSWYFHFSSEGIWIVWIWDDCCCCCFCPKG